MGGGQEELTGPDLEKGIAASELKASTPLLGHFGGEPVLLVRLDGEIFAVAGKCTHYGGPLHEGVISGETVHCPWHHACFDLRTGEPLEAPALADLPTFRVAEANGHVRVVAKVSPPATLAEGAKVSYDVEQGPKGPAAANVQTL